jgi:hypothetical protein
MHIVHTVYSQFHWGPSMMVLLLHDWGVFFYSTIIFPLSLRALKTIFPVQGS